MPNTGVDPLTIAAHILLGLQEFHARELAMDDRAALTIGTMEAGTAANVIPDTVTMGGSLRTYEEETRAFLKQRMTELADYTARAYRGTASVTFQSGCPTLVNDRAMSQCAETYLRELLGPQRAISVAAMGTGGGSKSAGSEDFAYVSQEIPTIMVALAAGTPEAGYGYPQHHPKVQFDEAALPVGTGVFTHMALRWLEEHPL
jgi:hippurate hydrolase